MIKLWNLRIKVELHLDTPGIFWFHSLFFVFLYLISEQEGPHSSQDEFSDTTQFPETHHQLLFIEDRIQEVLMPPNFLKYITGYC